MLPKDTAIHRLTEHLVTFMALSDIQHREAAFRGKPLRAMDFSGAEPLLPGVHADLDDYLIFRDAGPRDLTRPLDVKIIAEDTDCAGDFVAHRVRAITPKQARGEVRRPLPYMVDLAHLFFSPDKPALARRWIMGSTDGVWWQSLTNAAIPDPTLDAQFSDIINVGHGIRFTQDYFWSVQLGWIGLPLIRIPTDPVGAREVFRLRDIPEGKARRAALRHWVEEHWRKDRRDPSEEVKVREHLRGKTVFTWGDLQCIITPSTYDIERAREAKIRREEERLTGEDRRPAVFV